MDKIYYYILKMFKPIIEIIGKMHAPYSHKKITGETYYKLRDELSIGCVILANTNGEFGNLINPSKMKHSAIYVGRIKGNDICYVAEALGRGVILTDLVTFLLAKDIVKVCKPKFIVTDNQKELIQERALNYLGLSYDYYFSENKSEMYCFELCFHVLDNEYLKMKEIVKGKKIFDYETFTDKLHFNVTFDSEGLN